MIYIEVENKIVRSIHFKPFSEKDGLGKTEEELKKTGYLVENIPSPQQVAGKTAVLMYDNESLYYEYIDRPLTAEEELAKVRADNEILTESLIDFKTQYMAVPCQNHQDYPVVIDKIIEEAKKDGTV